MLTFGSCVFAIRSDEGLTLQTSALESLHDCQITLSTLLIKPTIRFHSLADAAPYTLFLEAYPQYNSSYIVSIVRRVKAVSTSVLQQIK